jgi:hypothetical protein
VESLAKTYGKIINLMGAVDFDSLACGIEDDLAVLAAAQVGLQFSARFGSHRVIDQIIEKGEKLFAGHFLLLASPSLDSVGPFFLWK